MTIYQRRIGYLCLVVALVLALVFVPPTTSPLGLCLIFALTMHLLWRIAKEEQDEGVMLLISTSLILTYEEAQKVIEGIQKVMSV